MGYWALKRKLYFSLLYFASCLAVGVYQDYKLSYGSQHEHNRVCPHCQWWSMEDEGKHIYSMRYDKAVRWRRNQDIHHCDFSWKYFHNDEPSWSNENTKYSFNKSKLESTEGCSSCCQKIDVGTPFRSNRVREILLILQKVIDSPEWLMNSTEDGFHLTEPERLILDLNISLASLSLLMSQLACLYLLKKYLVQMNDKLLTKYEEPNKHGTGFWCLRNRSKLCTFDISFQLRNEIRRLQCKIKPGTASERRPWTTKLKDALDPHLWRGFALDYVVYPAFQLLATYSQLQLTDLPNNVSVLQLADAGFEYTGQGSSVQCQDCRAVHEISFFRSDPSDSLYHETSCHFLVKNEISPTAPEVSKNDDGRSSNYKSNVFYPGDGCDIQTDSAESDAKDHLPCSMEELPCELSPKENHGESTLTLTDGATRENKVKMSNFDTWTPHSQTLLHDDRGHGTAEDLNFERVNNESLSASCSSSGYYSSASANSTSNTIPQENAEASNGTNRADCDAVEGFVDQDTFKTEAQLSVSSHNQVPPVLTIQCEKNKGHFAYFPIRQLELKHIPSCVRFPQVIEFLKLAAMLTVRVIVNSTSINRHEKDPARNSQNIQGTGSCFERQAETSDKGTESEHPGKWNPMKKLFTGMKHKSGRIYVETSRHVIFDDYEAKNTDVEFFYNHPDRKEIKIVKGVSIEHSGTLGDYKSVLICKTSDLGLVELVNQTRQKMMDLLGKFSPDIKDGLLRRIFVIGHPHGGEKVLSYGDSVEIKYNLTSQEENGRTVHGMKKISNQQQVTNFGDQSRKVLLYTADTCRGSSGSPILTFKTKNPSESEVTGAGAVADQSLQMELWMHNGIDIKHGLGGSLMKELTVEDIANHGKPSGTRAYAQDNMNRNNGGDGQSSFTQVPSCPVFTVVGHPSYPAYVAYQSRLDSYNQWRHHHIHLPVHLAEAGFFYAGYADCVRCFQCGIGLRTWKEGDDVYFEHYKARPSCQFLQMQLRVRGINDPETQLRPQATEVSSSSGSEGSRPSGSELPKIAMMVQQTTSTSTDQTARKTHYARESEEAGLSCAGQTVTSFAMPRRQEVVVGFVTDSLTLKETTSSSESQIRNNPGAASCSGAANGNKNVTYTVLERENQLLTKQLTCKVCFMKPIQDLFLPCGELYACTDCSKLLTHCPSCKKQILATVTTYFT